MKISDILYEAATAPLYHGTTFEAAMEIVRDGAFRSYTSIVIGRQPYFGISTSRSPRLSHIDHQPEEKPWEKDTIEGFHVIFVLDQNKVRQHYKIIPFDFFLGRSPGSFFHQEVNRLRNARSESEEFIAFGLDTRGKMPIQGIVSKIIYFNGSFKDPDNIPDTDAYLAFKKLALSRGIPVVGNYDTLFGFNDNDRPWNNRLRQSMITHADKNEVKVGPEEWETEIMLKLMQKYEAANGPSLTTEQLAELFDAGEQCSIWNFWLRMHGRFPAQPTHPVSDKVMARVFKAIKKADPRTKTIYQKISPVHKAKTPDEKKQAGLARKTLK
jgi:hypothetical protein